MIEHSLSIICRVEEDESDEESTAEVVKELNPQHESVPENLCHHHLEEHRKLLQARQRVLALEKLRQLLHFLNQSSFIGSSVLHLERRRRL